MGIAASMPSSANGESEVYPQFSGRIEGRSWLANVVTSSSWSAEKPLVTLETLLKWTTPCNLRAPISEWKEDRPEAAARPPLQSLGSTFR